MTTPNGAPNAQPTLAVAQPVGKEAPPSTQVMADVARDVLDHPAPSGADAMRAEVAAETTPFGGGVQSGWYVDPSDPQVRRYWDGDGWVGEPQPANQPPPSDPPPEPIPTGSVEVPLCGKAVYVLPRNRWRSSGLAALNRGDFDTWAEACLARDVDFDVWMELDPTIDDIEAMFEAYGEATGQNVGKSRALRRSSARMGRR